MPRSHKTVKDKLDEALDIANPRLEKAKKEKVEILPPVPVGSIEKYNRPEQFKPQTLEECEFAQVTYHNLIDKGSQALNSLLDVAEQSESARDYEVVGQIIKSVADVATALVNLQEKINKIAGVQPTEVKQNLTQNNGDTFVFSGTTNSLLDAILAAKEKASKK
jgi:hypothetical protein